MPTNLHLSAAQILDLLPTTGTASAQEPPTSLLRQENHFAGVSSCLATQMGLGSVSEQECTVDEKADAARGGAVEDFRAGPPLALPVAQWEGRPPRPKRRLGSNARWP